MADLGDHHRLFLQTFMWRKICRAKEVLELYRNCHIKCGVPLREEVNPVELSSFVNKINCYIRPIHMEIRKGIEEDTGINCYALVNTMNSSISLLSSDYNVLELEFFKKIVDKIVLSEEGVASSVVLLNLAGELDRLSKKDAEDLIGRFVEDQFLHEKDGVISLSVRSMIELDPYLRQFYSEVVVMCPMCNQIAVKGQSCDECEAKLHFHCAVKYFRRRTEWRCPRCGAKWPSQSTSEQASSSRQPSCARTSGIGLSP